MPAYLRSPYFDPAWLTPVAGTPYDLPALCCAALLADSGFVAAFGTGALYSEVAAPGTALPYVVYEEPNEDETFQSTGPDGTVYFGRGTLTFHVLAAAKLQSRQLGDLVGGVLNVLDLTQPTFTEGMLLELRWSNPHSQPMREVGPDGSVPIFHRVLTFLYAVQRQL